jgi:hypothetical protein
VTAGGAGGAVWKSPLFLNAAPLPQSLPNPHPTYTTHIHTLKVSTVLGSAIEEQRHEGEWIEGIAIWIAVLLVVAVGASLVAAVVVDSGAAVLRVNVHKQ